MAALAGAAARLALLALLPFIASAVSAGGGPAASRSSNSRQRAVEAPASLEAAAGAATARARRHALVRHEHGGRAKEPQQQEAGASPDEEEKTLFRHSEDEDEDDSSSDEVAAPDDGPEPLLERGTGARIQVHKLPIETVMAQEMKHMSNCSVNDDKEPFACDSDGFWVCANVEATRTLEGQANFWNANGEAYLDHPPPKSGFTCIHKLAYALYEDFNKCALQIRCEATMRSALCRVEWEDGLDVVRHCIAHHCGGRCGRNEFHRGGVPYDTWPGPAGAQDAESD